MVTPRKGGKKEGEDDGDEAEWQEVYKELHKIAVRLGQYVKV